MFFTMTATIPSTTINIPRKKLFKRRLIKIKNNKTMQIKVFCVRIWHASEISRRIYSNKQFVSGLQTNLDNVKESISQITTQSVFNISG